MYIVFGTVVGLAALSIALAVANWFVLHSLSGRLTTIDQEIEKKSLEFDTLRKERSTGGGQQAYLAGTLAPETEDPGSATSEIQVVRNVRDGYDNAGGSHLEGTIVEMGGPAYPPAAAAYQQAPQANTLEEPYLPQAKVPPPQTVYAEPPAAEQSPEPAEPPAAAPVEDVASFSYPVEQPEAVRESEAADSGDVMAVVGDGSSEPMPPDNIIRIPIYSDEKKDADFQKVSQRLKDEFPLYQNPSVILDFSKVNFIYEKELEYLNKLAGYTAGRRIPLLFVNCDRELLARLEQHPSLHACVRG